MSTEFSEGETGGRLRRPARIVRPARRRPPARPAASRGPEPAALGLDPADLAGALLADLAEVAGQPDPFEFEMLISSFCGILDVAQAAAFTGALPPDVVPVLVGQFEARGDGLSLAVLATLALLAEGEAGGVAARAAARLWQAGVLPPDWFEEIDRAILVEECVLARRELDGVLILLCAFRRAGRRHGFAVVVRDEEHGAAEAVAPLPAEVLPADIADLIGGMVPADELDTVTVERLEPAEARRLLESALHCRAVQDARLDLEARFEQWNEAANAANVLGAPPYPTMIAALRNRIEIMPAPPRALPADTGYEDEDDAAGDGFEFDLDLAFPDFPAALGAAIFAPDQPPAPAAAAARTVYGLPRRRGPLDGPAPVYRLRIDLKGAKPPIWRRIEVPGDTTLAALHEIIQTVFEWEGYHLHVFETGFGDFGDAEVDLGHGLEAEVTIEQILAGPGAKLVYVYDYGDYWEHVVRVERTGPAQPDAVYPRCTGGRRAAPPEDCGGLWDYQLSLRDHGDAGADVFDREELNRLLADRRWTRGPWNGRRDGERGGRNGGAGGGPRGGGAWRDEPWPEGGPS